VFLILDPNGTLIGARATRAEANRLIEEHAMGKMKSEIENGSIANLDRESIWAAHGRTIVDYKVEAL
jgi:hypothetical protein